MRLKTIFIFLTIFFISFSAKAAAYIKLWVPGSDLPSEVLTREYVIKHDFEVKKILSQIITETGSDATFLVLQNNPSPKLMRAIQKNINYKFPEMKIQTLYEIGQSHPVFHSQGVMPMKKLIWNYTKIGFMTFNWLFLVDVDYPVNMLAALLGVASTYAFAFKNVYDHLSFNYHKLLNNFEQSPAYNNERVQKINAKISNINWLQNKKIDFIVKDIPLSVTTGFVMNTLFMAILQGSNVLTAMGSPDMYIHALNVSLFSALFSSSIGFNLNYWRYNPADSPFKRNEIEGLKIPIEAAGIIAKPLMLLGDPLGFAITTSLGVAGYVMMWKGEKIVHTIQDTMVATHKAIHNFIKANHFKFYNIKPYSTAMSSSPNYNPVCSFVFH